MAKFARLTLTRIRAIKNVGYNWAEFSLSRVCWVLSLYKINLPLIPRTVSPLTSHNSLIFSVKSSTEVLPMLSYLSDFLKTNPTKFAVIWVKRRQKARFLNPRSFKITVTKEKERRKRKSEEKERRGRKKKAMVALLVFIIATLEIVFGRKKLLDAKGPFGDDVFKNPARYIYIALSIKI